MATIIVDALSDVTDAGDSRTSLHEAVDAANAGDFIEFSSGLSGGTISLTQGQIVLAADITIVGDV